MAMSRPFSPAPAPAPALAFIVLAALGAAEAAHAVCDTTNFNNPENDCDNDGQTVGAGDCNDCDHDHTIAGVADCNDAPTDPGHAVQNFADPRVTRLGASEVCDGFDNTCNNVADEGFDQDGDGFTSCDGDCNDSNATIRPGATEQCDGVDQDCDGVADGSENITRSCYDGPGGTAGVGVCRQGTQTCTGATFGTCTGQVLPSAEICDGLNNDCDAQGADEGLAVDADNDGTRACGTCGAPSAPNCDCNDNNPNVEPGRAEQCNGVDDDCDGVGDAAENITQQCYDNFLPPGGSPGSGACSFGTQTCTGAAFGACTGDGAGASATETCNNIDDDCDGTTDEGLVDDSDNDGARECGTCGAAAAPNCDCNDANPAVRPGAAEQCNGINDDCDAFTDERNAAGDPLRQNCYEGPGGTQNVGVCRGGTRTCTGGTFVGATCDGQVLPSAEICDGLNNDCDAQGADEGFVVDVDNDGTRACGTCQAPAAPNCDCDDADPLNEPGRNEVCDGQDNNCNTLVDEGFDDDADSFLDCNGCVQFQPSCDCNDNDNSINPAAPEDCGPVDRNCNNQRFDGFTDADGDGVPGCFAGECDDARNNVHGAYGNVTAVVDTCDGLDNDCNGTVDRAANGNPIAQTCYEGPNGTVGVGTCRSGTRTCNAAAGSGVPSFGTCNGQVLPTNDPAQDETLCNGADDDCDVAVDDGFDDDSDGFSTCTGDCADDNPAAHPGAPEACDGTDQDCDGDLTDVAAVVCFEGPFVTPETFEGVCPGPGCDPKGACQPGSQTCRVDGTIGPCEGSVTPTNDPAGPEALCNFVDDDCDGTVDDGPFDQDGDGFTTCGGDCDDADASVNPDALELCDNVDNDCDGDVDGAQTACYSGPAGTEGVGICVAGTSACVAGQPQGLCANEVVPAEDVCDLVDNDCDGQVDEDFDVDGDGYASCALCPDLLASECDCDDADPFNNPGRPEVCDCQDNNCNTNVDEGNVCRAAPCHDIDGDGATNCQGDCDDNNAAVGPQRPEIFGNGRDDDCDGATDEDVDEDGDGVTTAQGDCDDRFAEVHPGAPEVCDLFDNDCNGQTDEGFDADGDGARVCVGDCDDADPARSPFRGEICQNGVDDDCDGVIDEDTDADGDGVSTCNGDCNDFNAAVHPAFGAIPAAEEVCDGQSNDCAGPADEGFDVDGDGIPSCLGDCDDTTGDVSPIAFEVPQNGVDDDCDGDVDENDDDRDGDGFTGACGDCDDGNAAVNPHSDELCDRIDNNCDAFVDALPGDAALCAVCFDNDADQYTNCDGDCDDTDPDVFPAAEEVCNGRDDDCDRRVDLTADGFRVCGDEPDAGVIVDDAGSPDAGGEGEGEKPADEVAPVVVGCTCAAGTTANGTNGASPAAAAPFAALLAGLALLRRRRSPARRPRGAPIAPGLLGGIVFTVALGAAGCGDCGGARVPPGLEIPGEGEGEGEGEEGEGEGEPAGPCDPGLATRLDSIVVPGARNPFAVPENADAVELEAVAAIALDSDADVSAIVLTRPLPPGTDPTAADAAARVLAADAPLLDVLAGSPVVATRVETGQRVFRTRDVTAAPSASASYKVELAGGTTAAQVRNRVAQVLADAEPAALNDLPGPRPTALFTDQLAMAVFVRVIDDVSITVVALSPHELLEANLAMLADLTNGTHLGPPGTVVDVSCEEKLFPTLRSDFIFVIDNSGSMQEEQQALANAAVEFNAALQSSGLDARLGVITTDSDVLRGEGFTADVTRFQQDVQVGIAGNGFEMGLEFAARAVELAETNALPERRFRDDAARVVVIFSDEEAGNLRTLSEYASFFSEHEVILYAIVGPRPTGCQFVGLGTAAAGESYIEVAQATGGTSASICNPNLAEAITDILVGAAGAASRSPLVQTPISGSIVVELEGVRVVRSRQDGFDYEAASNTVLLFGTRPPEGTPVDVSYAFFRVIGG